MDEGTLVNELVRTQKRLSEVEEAVAEYKELVEELENSHDNAFGHMPKSVQRTMHEKNEARKRLFNMVSKT